MLELIVGKGRWNFTSVLVETVKTALTRSRKRPLLSAAQLRGLPPRIIGMAVADHNKLQVVWGELRGREPRRGCH